MIDEERGLLNGVELERVPLSLYADWLEEHGDERFPAVRWMADHDKRPEGEHGRFHWSPLTDCPNGLSPTLMERLATVRETDEPFDEFAKVLSWGIYVVNELVVERGLDERIDMFRHYDTLGNWRSRAFLPRWLRSLGDETADGLDWLMKWERHPKPVLDDVWESDNRSLFDGEFHSWTSGQSNMVVRGASSPVLPIVLFESLTGGRRRSEPYRERSVDRLVQQYESVEAAITDAARAVLDCMERGELSR